MCNPELYIWEHFFGEPGSLKGMNIVNQSSIMGSIIDRSFDTEVELYFINEIRQDHIYFLVDGIYPAWSIFAKTNPAPLLEEEKYCKKRHKHVCKDIECAMVFLWKGLVYLIVCCRTGI